MDRWVSGLAAALVAAALSGGVAYADSAAPELGAGCPDDLAGAMTLLLDGQTYAVCEEGSGGGNRWAAAPTPFEPNDTWVSYGPAIILHGQGMRNPNVTSGDWIATPQNPETVCLAEQQTVIEAGKLSEPQIAEAERGEPLMVEFRPKLFYLTLSGECVWTMRR